MIFLFFFHFYKGLTLKKNTFTETFRADVHGFWCLCDDLELGDLY
jgi:hypothetical protein